MTKFARFVRTARTMHHLHKGFVDRLYELEPEDVVRLPRYMLNAALLGTVWNFRLQWGCCWKKDDDAFLLDDYIDSDGLTQSARRVRTMRGGERALHEALAYVQKFAEVDDVRELARSHFAAACVIAWLHAKHGNPIPSSAPKAVKR